MVDYLTLLTLTLLVELQEANHSLHFLYSNNHESLSVGDLARLRMAVVNQKNKLCGRPPQYAPASCKLTFDLESGVRVKCGVGYLRANFSLPRPLFST